MYVSMLKRYYISKTSKYEKLKRRPKNLAFEDEVRHMNQGTKNLDTLKSRNQRLDDHDAHLLAMQTKDKKMNKE